ncbi:NAD(P)-binding domain-containing protein [Azohydromonas australica]|uniref:NAD(P)-binding domain-containing protein n=1 Tax=Azohydromonas australica TaxID=364039 RepID=UPI000408CC86|nr:NAD(P)-binding domain-containing protein [Azohydromonas australica]
MTSLPLKVGFVGPGIMGAPICGHLIRAGHQLFVYAHGKVPREMAESSATQCTSVRGVAQRADIIFTLMPDTSDVESVLFDEKGLASGLKAGKVVVDLSSICPIKTKRFAQRLNEIGVDYLDAPAYGDEMAAKVASLTFTVGGPQQTFSRVKPLLELMGKNITLVGSNGDGQITKVAHDILVALNIAAVGEALVFASKAGASPARVRQALMGGFAASRILDVYGERMIERAFEAGIFIDRHQKELNLALESARSLSVALPGTASAAQLMQGGTAHGLANQDQSTLIHILKSLTNREAASQGWSDCGRG